MNPEYQTKNVYVGSHKGVTIVVQKKPHGFSNTFDARVSYKVGALNEDPSQSGISHFVEHAVFLGAKDYQDRFDIERKLMSFGGDYNAFTSFDNTGYSLSGRKKDLEDGLKFLCHFSQEPHFEKYIDDERNVVLNEIEGSLDKDGKPSDPDEVAYEVLFKDTALQHPIGGYKTTVSGIDGAALKAYHAKHYRPQNCCISVISPVSAPNVAVQISRLIDSLPSNGTRNELTKIAPTHSCAEIVYRPSTQEAVELHFYFEVGKLDWQESASYAMLSKIMFHSEISLIFGQARQQGLVYGFSGGLLPSGVYCMRTMLLPENIGPLSKIILKAFKKFSLPRGGFKLWKNSLIMDCEGMKDNMRYQRAQLEDQFFIGRNMLPPPMQAAKIAKTTTLEKVKAEMPKIFKSQRKCLVVKGDFKEEGKKILSSLFEELCNIY